LPTRARSRAGKSGTTPGEIRRRAICELLEYSAEPKNRPRSALTATTAPGPAPPVEATSERYTQTWPDLRRSTPRWVMTALGIGGAAVFSWARSGGESRARSAVIIPPSTQEAEQPAVTLGAFSWRRGVRRKPARRRPHARTVRTRRGPGQGQKAGYRARPWEALCPSCRSRLPPSIR